MDCPNCGNMIRPEAVYCPRCGVKIDQPPARGSEVADLDAAVLDGAFLDGLARMRLDARELEAGRLATGIDGHELERRTASVLELHEPARDGGFEATAELAANVRHPQHGEVTVVDTVVARGESPEAALAAAAETYLTVTFSALQTLFPATRGTVPQLDLADYKLGDGSSWQLHNGHLQLLGEERTAVQMRLRRPPAPVLVLDTLNVNLSDRQVHWCKVDAAHTVAEGLQTDVTIDGRHSTRGDSELRRKLLERGDIPGEWQFRQFFVLTPL
jgi:hypothetical protein